MKSEWTDSDVVRMEGDSAVVRMEGDSDVVRVDRFRCSQNGR